MRRAAGLAVLFALVAAAPAAGQATGPAYLDFESQAGRDIDDVYAERGDIVFRDNDSCGSVVGPGGNLGPNFLSSTCEPIRITFSELQTRVSLFGQLGFVGLRRGVSSFTVTAFGDTLQPPPIDTVNQENSGTTWDPVTVRTPNGQPGIREVVITWSANEMHVDDFGYSPFARPATTITGGPADPTTSTDATFTFAGNEPALEFFCKLDQGASQPCTSPITYSGLGLGSHTFTVITSDDLWGNPA